MGTKKIVDICNLAMLSRATLKNVSNSGHHGFIENTYLLFFATLRSIIAS